jgi:nucleotide-binding universal stress UspA family protein
MSYAAILVHAEVDPAAEQRLRLAAELANDFDARLIGVAAELFEPPTVVAAAGYLDGETMVAEAKVVEEDLKLAETKFQDIARGVRRGADWRCAVALPDEMIALQARAADLIVAGPRRPEPYGFHNRADPGDILMQSGRPVLIAPPAMARLDASIVVVGWKDTRESRRAIHDALPFLKRANQVVLTEICESRDETEARVSLADVADYLGRHAVKVSTTVRAPDRATVAEALLEVADIQGAGLVVVGGYGHTRLREWVFGGVTQELLGGCHKAVLLSH